MSATTDIPIVAALSLPCDTNLHMDIDDPSELKATHDVGSVIVVISYYIKNTKILPNQSLKETLVKRQGVIPQDSGTLEQAQTTYPQDVRSLEQAELMLSLFNTIARNSHNQLLSFHFLMFKL